MRLVLLAALTVLSCPFGAYAQAPPTVGDVVLLSTRTAAERTGPLGQALTAEDPRVRAAAARVMAVTTAPELQETLSQALARESSPQAGAEQVRAMLLLKGASLAAVVEPHARRIGGAAVVAYIEWLAGHDPARLATALAAVPDTAGTGRRNGALDRAVMRAASDGSAVRFDVLQAWSRVAPVDSWRSVLQGSLRLEADVRAAEGTLATALRSEQEHIREETVWFLLDALAAGNSPPQALLAAVERPSAIDDWEAYGRELLYRHTQRAAPVDASRFLASKESIHRLGAIRRLNLLSPPEVAELQKRLPNLPAGPVGLPASEPVKARTVQVWAEGLVSELARSAGCSLGNSVVAGIASVTFRSDGRLKRIEVDRGQLPERCVPVLQALAMTTIAEVHRPMHEDQQQWVILPLSRASAACLDRMVNPTGIVGRQVGDAVITTPRKIRDVKPQYPRSMLEARRGGTVILEATISDDGCTRDLHVVRSSGADALDVAGLLAVTQWLYEPTRLNGAPIPVQMTVSVNFRVQ